MSNSRATTLSRLAGIILSAACLVLVTQFDHAGATTGEGGENCLKCVDGTGYGGSCVVGRHLTQTWHGTQGGEAHEGYPYSDCLVGSCSDKHPDNPECEGDGGGGEENLALRVPLDSVVSTVLASRGDELLIEIEKLGSRVTYNASRQSVQVASCTGSIIANLPLTSEQITSLAEASQE